MRKSKAVFGIATLTSLSILSGCSSQDNSAQSLVAPAPIENVSATADALVGWHLGDCLWDVTQYEGVIAPETMLADCSARHTGEIYAVIPKISGLSPNLLSGWVDEQCVENFELYVGSKFYESTYSYGILWVDDYGRFDPVSFAKMPPDQAANWIATTPLYPVCYVVVNDANSVYQSHR